MADRNYGALRSAEKFEAFVDRIISADKSFGFDIESGYLGEDREGTALQTFHPAWLLVGFSFTNSLEWARYVPIAHDDGDNVDDIPRTARALWRLLQSGLGVAHNLSFEMRGLSRWFMETLSMDPEVGDEVLASHGQFPYRSDTLIEAFLTAEYNPLNPGQDLKGLTKHIFGHEMIKFADLFPALKGVALRKARFNRLPLDTQVVTYACEDSVWCLALHLKHYDGLKDTLVYKTEMGLVPILADMEAEGLYLDWAEISRKADEVKTLQALMNEEIQADLSERLGRTVNINLGSVKQLQEILFEELGLPVKERSEKTNMPSTSEKALGLIAKADPVIGKILQYRQITKLYGSYLDKYRKELNYAGTGRAHPNHKQTGAATGRMSVDGVSYQQWPKPYHYELKNGTVFDLNFRNLLISPEGYRIIGFDYSQVELRVLAGQANETAMLHAFANNIDIHKATASSMMGIPLEQITKKNRAVGKTLNFAVVYGSGPENIGDMLSTPEAPVSKDDAIKMLEQYFAAFGGLRAWMDSKIAEGREQGFVTTMFGRRYRVWEYLDHRNWIRSKGDRMCVNAPVQGGAADYMKIAMVRAAKAIKKAGLQDKIRLFMTIHDALEFYVHESISTQTVVDLVGPAVSYAVPTLPEIRADWHEGRRWGAVVELKLDDAKQIVGYAIEDVDEEFASIAAAYEYIDAHAIGEKPLAKTQEPEAESVEDVERHAMVTLTDMPDENQWALFRDYIDKRKGSAGVSVVTPEGAVEFPESALGKKDQPAISALLGGAFLSFVDDDALTSLVDAL